MQWIARVGDVPWPPAWKARPNPLPPIAINIVAVEQPQPQNVRLVRQHAMRALHRNRCLYVRSFSRFSNTFWVYNIGLVGLVRLSWLQFISRLRQHDFEEAVRIANVILSDAVELAQDEHLACADCIQHVMNFPDLCPCVIQFPQFDDDDVPRDAATFELLQND